MTLEDAISALLGTNDSDARQYFAVYDAVLWAAVTAPRDELLVVARRLFSAPCMDVPPPLQVAIFRLVGLESPKTTESQETALAGIAMYCDPIEEKNIVSGIVAS